MKNNEPIICITGACNQKCLFCSNPEIDATLAFDEVVNLLKLYSSYNYEGVVLTGGEPTLHSDLFKIIAAAARMGLQVKLITNAQRTAEAAFFDELVSSGLSSLIISLYSHKPEIQNYLSGNPDSFRNIQATLENTLDSKINITIAITINASNADHLHTTVERVAGRYPQVIHYVFNNLDPLMNRATLNPHTIPELHKFELSLFYAMTFLREQNITFRVERVPLCYMGEFASCSSETRNIIKREERSIFFLDSKGLVRQQEFLWSKAECCNYCFLSSICAGLFAMDNPYDKSELYALFLDPSSIENEVLNGISD